MDTVKSGQVSVIHYRFPKPGSTVEEPAITYYTEAGDQTCAVGVYDADVRRPRSRRPRSRRPRSRRPTAESPNSASGSTA